MVMLPDLLNHIAPGSGYGLLERKGIGRGIIRKGRGLVPEHASPQRAEIGLDLFQRSVPIIATSWSPKACA
jgi:hypothetical protein